jgi:hypothetical protein
LDRLIRVLSTDEAFSIEDCIFGIDGGLIFGSITDEAFSDFCEGNVGGSDTVALVVAYDLDFTIFEDADTGVSCAKIDTNDGGLIIRIIRRGSGEN